MKIYNLVVVLLACVGVPGGSGSVVPSVSQPNSSVIQVIDSQEKAEETQWNSTDLDQNIRKRVLCDPAVLVPDLIFCECCSPEGVCGKGSEFCDCEGCTDFGKTNVTHPIDFQEGLSLKPTTKPNFDDQVREEQLSCNPLEKAVCETNVNGEKPYRKRNCTCETSYKLIAKILVVVCIVLSGCVTAVIRKYGLFKECNSSPVVRVG